MFENCEVRDQGWMTDMVLRGNPGWQIWEKRLAGVKVGAWLDAKVRVRWLANV